MSSEPKLIEIQNATIWRGKTCVFKNLDLSIAQHEKIAILGPNGSGKTTLLKTINRELYPVAEQGSSIRILGRENWNVWQLRKQIGIVSHDLQQNYAPATPAIEVVMSGFFSSIGVHGILAARVTPKQRQAAEATMRELGLDASIETPLARMSTGQQRRCLLARALVHDPATLILDEPTAGLDFAASFDYLERLRGLANDGRNIVMVTHHLNEIPPEIDRVVLLQGGRIAADGPKESVLDPELLSRVYKTEVRVAQIDGYYLAYPGRSGKNVT
ncbi:MAG: ATP-binding cassette domain-containing protein [Gammaproteobacteria bacterium]|nr:ATP-binding cassette domain-containing protein [Gammaproteobacteria bacterium]